MFTLNCKGRLLVADKPLVMGIINVTPDSFYTGSRFEHKDGLLMKVEQMLNDGADILDVGGQSTRPGSVRITAEEELKRIIGAIEDINVHFPQAYISVDTYYSRVAREAVAAGASIVNDISAGTQDEDMITTVAELRVPYVLMHMDGEPGTFQQKSRYDNVSRAVLDFFIFKIQKLREIGIRDIIIDPGFGFGKTIQDNFDILKNLAVLKMLELPILVGLSRKSSIYKTLQISAEDSLNGTTVLNTISLMNGASILRVHDVKEAKQAIELVARYGK